MYKWYIHLEESELFYKIEMQDIENKNRAVYENF